MRLNLDLINSLPDMSNFTYEGDFVTEQDETIYDEVDLNLDSPEDIAEDCFLPYLIGHNPLD